MIAFVCEKEDEDPDAHQTSIAMVRCECCRQFAIGGYWCDCGHTDVDSSDRIAGHGLGKCRQGSAPND